MSTLFKKVTSAISVATLVATTLGTSIVAAASGFLPYAEALANAGVITKQSTEAGYRLADNALRQEVAAMMMALNKATYADDFSCAGKFSDVSATKPNSWACKVVETALSKGLVAANATFRPEDKITRAEALAMILKGQGIAIETGAAASFNDTSVEWQKDVANTALAQKIISANASFRPNDLVTRGELFVMAANAAGLEIASDELNLDDLFGTGSTGTTDTTTGATDTTTTPVVKAGDLSVTLSPSTPAGSYVSSGAAMTPVLSFDVKAGGSDVSVNQLTFKRFGVGASSDVSAVYLFMGGKRISLDKTVNSTTMLSDFVNLGLVVKAGETKTITLAATFAGTANDQHGFELTNVVSSAQNVTFAGVKGNLFTLSSAENGQVTVNSVGVASSDIAIGTSNVEVGNVNLVLNSKEDAALDSVRFTLTGSLTASSLANFKLYVRDTEVAASASLERIAGDDVVSFKLDTPYAMSKSQTYNTVVKADLVDGRSSDTFGLRIQGAYDVNVIGASYGQTLAVVNNYTAGSSLRVVGGKLTIGVGGQSQTVAKNSKNVVLATYTFNNQAGEELEMSNLAVSLNNDGDTAYSGAAVIDGDVKLVDGDGNTLSSRTAANTVTFERFNLASAKSTTIKVVADIKDGLSSGKVKVVLLNTFTAKTTGSRIALSSSDVTPSTKIAAYDVRISGSSLAVAPTASPSAQTYVKGAQGVNLGGYSLSTQEGSSAKITKVVVTVTGSGSDAKQSIASLYLAEDTNSGAAISAIKSIETDGTNYYVSFTSLNILVAENSSKNILVKANLANTFSTGTFNVATKIAANSDVTAYDKDMNTMTASVTTTATPTMTMITGGSTTISLGSSNPTASLLLAESTDNKVLSWSLQPAKEGERVDQVEVGFSGTVSGINKVYLTDGAGWTSEKKAISGTGVLFQGLNYVINDGVKKEIYVKVDMNSRTTGSNSGDQVQATIRGYKLYGAASNNETFAGTLDSAAELTSYMGNVHMVTLSMPTIAAVDGFTPSTSQIYKFNVSRAGTETLTLSGIQLKLGASAFTAFGSGTQVTIYQGSISNANIAFSGVISSTGSTEFAIESYTANPASLREIGDTSKDYTIVVSGGVANATKDYKLEVSISGIKYADADFSLNPGSINYSASATYVKSLPTKIVNITY